MTTAREMDEWLEIEPETMRAALEAGLAAMLEPAPQINLSERCASCGDVFHVGVSVSNHFRIKP